MIELFTNHRRLVNTASFSRVTGRVAEVVGLSIVAEGLPVPVGTLCRISPSRRLRPEQTIRAADLSPRGRSNVRAAPEFGDAAQAEACGSGEGVAQAQVRGSVAAQVVGVDGDRAILMTLQEPLGIAAGDAVTSTAARQSVAVGRQMLGGILDGMGRPIGGRTDFIPETQYPLYCDAPAALSREPIRRALPTGIRAVDAMHTIGGGQRMGIFAGTGVGKSVLMGMMARNTSADVIVVALIGERGREVGDFIRKDLGEEGLARCVLVVSTSDESPVLRVRAAFVATAVAEYFRDLGRSVLLLMDSATRIAMAQRQIGLSAGEPPTTRGYPPSVFALLPRLLERAGRTDRGSITGLYTVLVEGDDISEPISDALRGTLDGHIWLARDLAARGHYPAVSVLESISRVMVDVVDDEHQAAAAAVRREIAVWRDIEDLVNLGAYAAGSNPDFDVAVKMKPAIDEFLRQSIQEKAPMEESRGGLIRLANDIQTLRGKLGARRTE